MAWISSWTTYWQPNDQYWSFFVEWIFKNPIFHWYLILFLSEAVEASKCYFFKNWSLKLKFPNFLTLMISSPLAPKWPILVHFCGLDHQKSKFLLVSGNLDVRGCWGQPMLLFWKNIEKSQMSQPPKCAATFFWTWKSILVGHLGFQSMSYRVWTPCIFSSKM